MLSFFSRSLKCDIFFTHCMLFTALAFQTFSVTATEQSSNIEWYSLDYQTVQGDFNGDGLEDLLLQPLRPEGLNLVSYGSLNSESKVEHLFENTQSTPIEFSEQFWHSGHQLFTTGDFNGDGFEDLLTLYRSDLSKKDRRHRKVEGYVFSGSKDGLNLEKFDFKLKNNRKLPFLDFPEDYEYHAGDFNGDGKDDLFVQFTKHIQFPDDNIDISNANHYVVLSNKKGKIKKVKQFISLAEFSWLAAQFNPIIGDFNTDERDDIFVQQFTQGSNHHLIPSAQNGELLTLQPVTVADDLMDLSWNATDVTLFPYDVNEDNILDLLRIDTEESNTPNTASARVASLSTQSMLKSISSAQSPLALVGIQASSSCDDSLLSAGSKTLSKSVSFLNPISGAAAVSGCPIDLPPVIPGAPSSASVPSSNSTGGFTVNWSSVFFSPSPYYRLYQSTNGGSYLSLGSTLKTSWKTSGLSNGTYRYRVRACYKVFGKEHCGSYRYSNTATVSIFVAPPPPTAPSLSTFSAYGNVNGWINWTVSANASSFEVFKNVNGGGYTKYASYSGTTGDAIVGLSNGRNCFKVRGRNAQGYGSFSNSVCITLNNKPTTAVLAPYNNQVFTTADNVTVSAMASDSDSGDGISKVVLAVSGKGSYTVTSAPYSKNFGKFSVGSYTITATAYDNRGANQSSTSRFSVKLPNVAPSISPLAPTNNATILNTQSISAAANASDSDGSIKQVEFKLDSGSWKVDTTYPYSYNFGKLSAGSHRIYYRSKDNENKYSSSTPYRNITIRVNQAPSISPSSPSNNTTYLALALVGASATASDSDGSIKQVEFKVDSGSWRVDSTYPYSYNFGTLTTGSHTIYYRARDNEDKYSSTSSRNITIRAPNIAPIVSPLTPSNNATYLTTQSVSASANASDNDGSIARVEFKLDSGAWYADTTYPYSYSFGTLAAGSHKIYYRAKDNEGLSSISTSRNITVLSPPSVYPDYHGGNTDYLSTQPVIASATAKDKDGSIVQVEFKLDGSNWKVYSASPYRHSFGVVIPGNHTVYYRAKDNDNLYSSPTLERHIFINAPPTISGVPLDKIYVDEMYSFVPNVIELDNDPLVFSVTNKPTWATFDSATGELKGTPNFDDFGIYENIKITVSDGKELASLRTFSINVTTVLEDIPDAATVPLTRPSTTDIVGQLQGNASVSGGNVNYSIPILVPPGRQGMQPVLSFQYNSAQRNGLLGVGWSISGQTSISRCNANWTEDGNVDRVDLKDNDLLCLNGQKLVLVSGSYGANGSEYRTLHDSFSKITLHGGAYSSTASYFKVTSKSGQVAYYGETTNSILTPSGSTVPLTWSISKVYDNAETQNNMTFTYTSASGEQVLTDIYYTGQNDTAGNRRVNLIYEARDDVSFGYIAEGSVKTTKRLSSIATYVNSTKVFDYDLAYEVSNSPITGHSRLASIEQCGFESTTEKCLPKKEFTYSGDTLSFEVIESDNEVFNNGFPWSVANQLLGDFNNDGITDFASYDVLHLMSFEDGRYVIDKAIKTPFSTWGFDPREDSKLSQLDFNNDGQLDLIGINEDGNLSVAMLNVNKDGFDEQDLGIEMVCESLNTLAYLYNGNITLETTTKFRNACRAEPVSDGIGGYYLFHRSSRDDLYLSRIHSTCENNLCSTKLIPGIDKTSPGDEIKYHSSPSDYRFFDFDGDGDPDIARIEAIKYEPNSGMQLVWYRNDQTGNGPTASNNFVKIIKTIPNFTAEFAVGSGSHWIDANGDGLLDLLINNDDWYLLINQGGILAPPINTGIEKFYRSDLEEFISNENYTGPEHTTHNSIRVLDFNGDGLQDFIFLDRASTREANPNQRDCLSDRTRSYCREGSGFESPGINDFAISPLAFGRYSVYLSSLSNVGTVSFTKKKTEIQGSMNHLIPVDMNNDGAMDFIGSIWQDDHTTRDDIGSEKQTFFQLGQIDSSGIAPDLLTMAQDDDAVSSVGQKDEFTYQAFSQHKKLVAGSAAVDNSDLAGKSYYRIPSTQMVAVQHQVKNGNDGTNIINYTYGDPIYHQAGLGFLGFESVSEINVAQGTTSTASYLMDYPLNGKMDQLTLVETADSSVLKSQSNTWCDTITSACNSKEDGVYFVHMEGSVSNYFDPDGNAIKTETVTNNSFDDYGNIAQQTKVISDTSTTHTTVVDNEYITADETTWWLDKLDYSEVTKSVSYSTDKGIVVGTNGDKVQRRTVTWKENEARQLATETLTASDTELTMVSTYNNYDNYGNLTKVTRSGSAVTGTAYTDVQVNQVLEHNFSDSSGYFVNWQKNGLWANNTVTHTWDSRFGKMLTEVDINGLTLTNHYDVFGRITQVDSSNSPTVDMIYQWCSNCATNSVYSLTSMQDGAPTVVEAFNRIGKTLKKTVKSFAGNVSTNQQTVERFVYDALGRLTTHTLPHFSGETASTETLGGYDVLSRATTKAVNNLPQNYTTTYTFSGLETSISVNAGSDGTLSMARTYNALNQLISSTDANSNATYFHYDANGNAIFIMDVLENVISAKYDGLNNKQWFDDPNFGRRDFRYNALGQMRWQDDANSDEIRFDYDGLGRQTKRYVNDATHTTWTYDTRKKGVLSSLNSTVVNKNYYYDAQVRVVRETSEIHNQLTTRAFNIGYSYDAYYGRVKGIGYPSGGVVAKQYDQYGYETANIDSLNNTTYRTVNSLSSQGKIKQQQLGNGLYNIASFARSGEMSRVCVNNSTTCGGSNSLDEISYSNYDNFGNLKTANNVVNEITENYVYDSLHRIDSATRAASGVISPEFSPTATIDYDYDAVGNLTSKGDYASTYNYVNTGTLTGGPNAVKSVAKLNGSQVNFTYDDNGNLTAGDGLNITYNHFNKPINIIRNNVTLAFKYDGDEQRALQVAQHANKTVSTYYVGKLFEQVETTANGSTNIEQRDYLGDYAVISHTDSGRNVRYLHRDRLGSVSMISDGDQHIDDVNAKEELVLERKGYDVFGKPRDLYWGDGLGGVLASNVTNRGFTDHEHLDSVQLIHMNGRGYDYNLGRFLSVDPFIQFPESSQSINPYSYGMNNPLAGTDPSGYLFFLIPAAIEIGSGALALYGAWEAGQTVGNAVNDIASGTRSTSDVITSAAKDLAVDGIMTVTGTKLAKLAPTSIKKKVADLFEGKDNGSNSSNKVETGQISDTKQTKIETLDANRKQGKDGEDKIRNELGDKNRGEQVTVETLDGDRARIDFVTTNEGKPHLVEVKTGNAKLSKGQKKVKSAIDRGEPIIPRGKNAEKAGMSPNIPLQCSFETRRC